MKTEVITRGGKALSGIDGWELGQGVLNRLWGLVHSPQPQSSHEAGSLRDSPSRGDEDTGSGPSVTIVLTLQK